MLFAWHDLRHCVCNEAMTTRATEAAAPLSLAQGNSNNNDNRTTATNPTTTTTTETKDLSSLLDWTQTGAQLVPLDDGHCPEGLRRDGQVIVPSQLATYTALPKPAVYVTDNAVDPKLCQAWYETMTTTASDAAWGTYVALPEIYHYWQQQQEHGDNQITTANVNDNLDDQRHTLAVVAAAAFVQQAWNLESGRAYSSTTTAYTVQNGEITTTTTSSQPNHHDNKQSCLTAADMPAWWHQRRAAGVAVWALCATQTGAAVPYHVDYAEQVRYATNIISMPLLGGVLHCTPDDNMHGGDFFVYLHDTPDASVQHYEQCGYKGQRRKNLHNSQDTDDPSCIVIPYRTNRLIQQAGYLPHGSTVVTSCGNALGRVVVGLNVFGDDVAQAVQAWPEHAPRFNDWVRQLRVERAKAVENKISLRAIIQRHPDKARAWCRQKRKAQFQASLRQLELQIRQLILDNNNNERGVSVEALQEALGQTNGSYPSADDVWVFVAHRCTGPDALYRIVSKRNDDKEKLTSVDQLVLLRKHPQHAE